MVTEITRHDVLQLIKRGAQLVDVLGTEEYADSHLPGAVNIPLATLGEQAPRLLDPEVATISYCYDSLCDMSARGAWRLASLGFKDVYDYVASKMDWIGAGLPFEGKRSEQATLGALAEPEVPTCTLGETPVDVRNRIGDASRCIVVNDRRVVLGVVPAERLLTSSPMSEILEEAPRTFRPHVTADEMTDQLDKSPRSWVLVTNLDGTLVGVADPVRVRRAATIPALT